MSSSTELRVYRTPQIGTAGAWLGCLCFFVSWPGYPSGRRFGRPSAVSGEPRPAAPVAVGRRRHAGEHPPSTGGVVGGGGGPPVFRLRGVLRRRRPMICVPG